MTTYFHDLEAESIVIRAGNDDGTLFSIVAGGTTVFAVDDAGTLTMSGDVTLDDLTVGDDVTITGSLAAADITATTTVTAADLVATDDVTVGDDLTVTGLATVGETLGVTGITTATGGLKVGTSENLTIAGIHRSANVAVAVPTMADAEDDEVAVDVSAAFTVAPALGDLVFAAPAEALPTDCVLCGAYVSATDQITVSFGTKEGGAGVTGANKNFKFWLIKAV